MARMPLLRDCGRLLQLSAIEWQRRRIRLEYTTPLLEACCRPRRLKVMYFIEVSPDCDGLFGITYYVNPSETIVYGALTLGACFVLTVALLAKGRTVVPLVDVILPAVVLLITRLSGGQ